MKPEQNFLGKFTIETGAETVGRKFQIKMFWETSCSRLLSAQNLMFQIECCSGKISGNIRMRAEFLQFNN